MEAGRLAAKQPDGKVRGRLLPYVFSSLVILSCGAPLCNLCLPGLLFFPLGFIYEGGHHVADARRKFQIINGSVWILIPDIDVVKEDLGVHGQRNSTA